MKKTKKILIIIILAISAIFISACGGKEDPNENNNPSGNNETPGGNNETPGGNNETPGGNNETPGQNNNPPSGSGENENKLLAFKSAAIEKLDELINPVISKIPNEDLKISVQGYYDLEKQYINGINDLDTAKDAANKVVEDTKTFVKDTLKPLAIQKINVLVNPLIEEITYVELKKSVQDFYNSEIEKINTAETISDVSNAFKEIIDDTKKFILDETEKIMTSLKNKALEELDPYVTALINKIPYETLKNDTLNFYNNEKKILESVNSFDGFEPCVKKIKDDLEEYALEETKKIAVSKLDEVVDAGIEKIPNTELKDDLSNFSKDEMLKINAVNKIEDVPSVLSSVILETEEHIKGLLITTVKDYISKLTEIENATAYDYLPAAMQPNFESNVVKNSDINYDFSSFTDVSSISKAGFGEQWQMIIENINQSVAMSKVFNVAQTALNAAGAAVDIYITNSYADEMIYTHNGNGFTCKFEFKNAKLFFIINIVDYIEIPGFGSVKPVVRMEYDLTKDAKGMFISLGDAYKVKYVIAENAYEMATTYGVTVAGKSGSRSSFLTIEKKNGKTSGHIYEYTTYEDSDKIKACADFYIENGYVSVVGNKASGITGFSGYINELYLEKDGRLLGYKVREELTILGVTGTYNTLWFNIWDIKGINTIKVTDKTNANKSGKSTVDVYLNNSSDLLSPTYNTKLGTKTSRKYDIEYRTRYYYTYDSESNKYVANAIQVPMMFIQDEDNYNSFTSDMLKYNKLDLSVSLSLVYLNKIRTDYSSLIDLFVVNKDSMSSELIIAYLEQYE